MQLTKFQRRQLRNLVEISTSFYETTRSLSDRINGTRDINGKVLTRGLRDQLKEKRLQWDNKARVEIEAIRNFANSSLGMRPETKRRNLAEAQKIEDEHLDAQRELEDEIRAIEAKMNEIQIEATPASRLADAVLKYAGLDRELQPTVSYQRETGGSA